MDAEHGARTSDELTFRRATDDDAPAIGDVWLASFRSAYDFPPAHPDEDVRQWLRNEVVPKTETWVAVESGGEVVGFMSLRDDDLDHLYVHPTWFGRGIGSRFIEIAKERRPRGLGLWTFQVNDRARGLYERRGFVAERFTDGVSNEEHQPDVRYVWRPSEGGEEA